MLVGVEVMFCCHDSPQFSSPQGIYFRKPNETSMKGHLTNFTMVRNDNKQQQKCIQQKETNNDNNKIARISKTNKKQQKRQETRER